MKVIHRIRAVVEFPESALEQDLALIKTQVGRIASKREELTDFARYTYGRGLLYLDDFYEDLAFIHNGLTDPGTQQIFRDRLDSLGFGALAKEMASVSMEGLPDEPNWGEPLQEGLDRISRFEEASSKTLAAEDRFNEASLKATKKLKFFQSAVVLIASAFGMHAAWHLLGIDTLTPREFVGFLFSVWAGNEALYWIIWERFKWIDPFKKWSAKEEYRSLIDEWKGLLGLSPVLSAQKAAAAAASKPLSNAKHADAQADAALESLFESLIDDDTSNDAAIKEELFNTFLRELQDGNGSRAMRILKALKESDPHSKAARMSEVVARVFQIRYRMEKKCLLRQTMKAVFRSLVLGLAVYCSNEALKYVLPDHLSHWRTVPNWILGGLGVRRIYPLVWLPHRVEALKRQANQEDQDLRRAFDELLEIDPSGRIVERIAEYDSGVAAHQLVTFAAADALAANPTGERTRALWNVVNHELSATHPAGSRVNVLLENTYRAQRTCVQRMLGVVKNVASPF